MKSIEIVTIANVAARTRTATQATGSTATATPSPTAGSTANGRYPPPIEMCWNRMASPYAPMPKKAALPSDRYPENPPSTFHAVASAAYMTVKMPMFTTHDSVNTNGNATKSAVNPSPRASPRTVTVLTAGPAPSSP